MDVFKRAKPRWQLLNVLRSEALFVQAGGKA